MIRTPQRGAWTYEVHEMGFNYKLSDIHSALGRSQLLKLEKFIARREDLARRYDLLLNRLPVRLPAACPPETRHARHLYPVRVANRSRVFADLRDSGIGVQVHYVPIHHHPAFADQSLDLSRTEAAYGELLLTGSP